METLNWTPHLDECLDFLDQQGASDQNLAAHIKIQLIGEETQKLLRLQAVTELDPMTIETEKGRLIGRLAILRQALSARLDGNVEGWYDVFFSIPVAEFVALPTVFFVNMMDMLVILYALKTSKNLPRDVHFPFDLFELMDRVNEILHQADAASDGFTDTYDKMSRALSKIKTFWAPSLVTLAAEPAGTVETNESDNLFLVDPCEIDWMDDLFRL
ncbi:hypothetical protein ANO11243_017830 [Dothideomycetidae sp. 11243]|nr:hypothetical protein ANO11243_017830 [fungal sp. No.11243]